MSGLRKKEGAGVRRHQHFESLRIWRCIAAGAVAILVIPGLPAISSSHTPFPGRTAGVRGAAPFGGLAPAANVPSSSTFGLWENLTPTLTTYPSPRTYQSMADDPLLHAIVLFGGNNPYTSTALGDTWEFVNGSWSDLTSKLATAPSARWGAGLAYDPAYQGLVLFGGRNQNASNWIFNDTWLFNATGWHPLSVTNGVAPSARTPYDSLVYDSVDGYLLLFGGNYGQSYRLKDTWSFAAGTWTELTSTLATSPPAAGFSAANDSLDGYDLFFGGTTWSGGNYGETWTFSHGAWTNRTAPSGPAPPMTSGSPAMSYDPLDQGVVLFSGQDNYYLDRTDTYLYAGGVWTNITNGVGTPPLGRWTGSLAFDSKLGGDLLVGGNEGNGRYYSVLAQKDTWVLSHPYRAPPATSAPASSGIPLLDFALIGLAAAVAVVLVVIALARRRSSAPSAEPAPDEPATASEEPVPEP